MVSRSHRLMVLRPGSEKQALPSVEELQKEKAAPGLRFVGGGDWWRVGVVFLISGLQVMIENGLLEG